MDSAKSNPAVSSTNQRLYAVASLLGDTYEALVCDLWAELEKSLGVQCTTVPDPLPHFSYHVAASYQREPLLQMLQDFARGTTPFRVRTAGLGFFTGKNPIIFIPIVRTPELTAIHRSFWTGLEGISEGIVNYYHPDRWIPHITLVHDGLTPEMAAIVAHRLLHWDFNWEIQINNLTLICNNCGNLEPDFQVELG